MPVRAVLIGILQCFLIIYSANAQDRCAAIIQSNQQVTSSSDGVEDFLVEVSIQNLINAYERGDYTAEDIVRVSLARIEKYETSYNAFTEINEKALAQARDIDQRRKNGQKLGSLAGVPIIVKDAINVAGLPTSAAWSGLKKETGGIDLIPDVDSTVVARLRKAGAIIIGKGNMPAFGLDDARTLAPGHASWDGQTYNAFRRDMAPGGSSTGVATAVAASFVVGGIGEETAGSIQNPAAAQELVGVKPTFGLVPSSGVLPLSSLTNDTVGPMTRSVADAALLLNVMVGYSARDPKTLASVGNIPVTGYAADLNETALQGKRIGLFSKSWKNVTLTQEVQDLYDRVVHDLKSRGAIIIEDPFAGSGFTDIKRHRVSPDPKRFPLVYELNKYFRDLGPQSAVQSLSHLKEMTGRSPFDEGEAASWYWKIKYLSEWPKVSMYSKGGWPIWFKAIQETEAPEIELTFDGEPDLSGYTAARSEYLRIFKDAMEKHQLDALVMPQMYREIPDMAGSDWPGAVTVGAINGAGLPAIFVPAGRFKSGSPFSVAFIGPLWSEKLLFNLAYDYEQATKHRKTPVICVAGQRG